MNCSYNLQSFKSEESSLLESLPRFHIRNDEEAESRYPQFFKDFLVRNRPCLVTADQVQEWPAVRNWVTSDGDINFDFLENDYGW